jgi:ferric-dicitrate binding protein FerR (iron transport regulator)
MDNQLFFLLVARKLGGEATEDDVKQLERFFNENDLYKEKFDVFKAYWDDKNSRKSNLDAAFEKTIFQIQEDENRIKNINAISAAKGKSGTLKFFPKFSKVAAILLLCGGSLYLIFEKPTSHPSLIIASPKEKDWQIKQIPKGTKSTITLADGTKVTLNADSRLKFPQHFSGVSREVYLTGEAFFDVTHNANMPFIIHTDKMNIKVLGTEFNVKSYPADSTSETTLIRGSIEVTLKDRPSDRIILRPKEKLIVANIVPGKTPAISQSSPQSKLLISNLHYVSKTDSTVVETSWLGDKLVFQDKSFGNLATDMERRYGKNIQFSNDDIKNYRFTGILEKENINEVLDALRMIENFNYKIVDSTVYIF